MELQKKMVLNTKLKIFLKKKDKKGIKERKKILGTLILKVNFYHDTIQDIII